MNPKKRTFSFLKPYRDLREILTDHKLGSLGDAYINLAQSLALSNRNRVPLGVKVKGSILAQALKKANLREHLPSRLSKHRLADAAEALIVYGWLTDSITLEETVAILEMSDNLAQGVTMVLQKVLSRVRLS